MKSMQAPNTGKAIAAMRSAGLLDGIGVGALVANVQGLAAAIDRDPQSAPLWREFRQAWQELRNEARMIRAGSSDDSDVDPIEQLYKDFGETEARDEAPT